MADELNDMKANRSAVKDALLTLFGHHDTDTSFYLLPPSDRTRLKLLVFDTVESAETVAGKLIGCVTTLQLAGRVLALTSEDHADQEDFLAAGAKKGCRVVEVREFDPRGALLANWTTEELQTYCGAGELNMPAKSVAKMDRAAMIEAIEADFWGTTGEGTVAEDPTDEIGERLLKIWEACDGVRAMRGHGAEVKELRARLEPHAEDLFAKGRKTRITDLRKLVGVLDHDEETYEGMTEALVEMGKA